MLVRIGRVLRILRFRVFKVSARERAMCSSHADYSLLYEGRQISMYSGLFQNDLESAFGV